jgi:1,4-alpha-glucan branching enzyme
MKWMMGWMHDTFRYFKTGHFFRPYIQDTITFSIMYFTDENFMLPLSHDEVVHGKSPMIYKMQGLEHQKFANLRALYAYMYMHPGAKLLFMGNEFAQTSEWNETSEIDWHLLEYVSHQKMKDCVKDLCHLYRTEPACYDYPSSYDGFQWVETNKRNECLLAFMRKGKKRKNDLFVVMNLSDQMLEQRTFKLEGKSNWREILNTNDIKYWGTGEGLNPDPEIRMIQKKNRVCEIKITIPPLSVLIFK